MEKGAYVLATKYSDGDPKDHFCIGVFEGKIDYQDGRYLVVGKNSNHFRNNGFRKCVEISQNDGLVLFSIFKEIQQSEISLWHWLRYVQECFS